MKKTPAKHNIRLVFQIKDAYLRAETEEALFKIIRVAARAINMRVRKP